MDIYYKERILEAWKKITKLAHLKLTKDEEDLIFPQIQSVIEYFNVISKVPTDSIEPLISPIEEEIRLRPDEVLEATEPSELLRQSCNLEESFVKVPLVVDSN